MDLPTVCLDFDGVLNDYPGWKGDEDLGQPAPGVRDFLAVLDPHYRIVIHTTRYPGRVWSWLVEHNLLTYVDDVTQSKPPSVVYVDDRAVRHDGDFFPTLADIDGFTAHWEQDAHDVLGLAVEFGRRRAQHRLEDIAP